MKFIDKRASDPAVPAAPAEGSGGGPAPEGRSRARASRETSTRVARLRAVLEHMAEPGTGRVSDEEVYELAACHGVGVGQIREDLSDASAFLALADTIGGLKPFITANLASMLASARERGKLGDGARLAEVLGKISGDISPAQVNLLVDARTGALRPEVASAMQQAQDELLAACRRAAVACGAGGEDFDAALVRELDTGAPVLLDGGG